MIKVVLQRESAILQDNMRDYVVLVDGEKAATLSNGETAELMVEPGKHTIQMKIDWCSSVALKFHAQEGDVKKFACGPNATPLLAILYVTFWRKRYLWLRAST